MLIVALLISLVLSSPAIASPNGSAPRHVVGKPMTFPVDAASALENLGKIMLTNCETDNVTVKQSCVARLNARMGTCGSGRPTVFGSKDDWQIEARDYLRCVMPLPICKGLEIRTDGAMRQHCTSRK